MLVDRKRMIIPNNVQLPVEEFKQEELFKFGGGAVDNLTDKIVLCHAKGVFGKQQKNVLTNDDILAGFKLFKKEKKSSKAPIDRPPSSMYI